MDEEYTKEIDKNFSQYVYELGTYHTNSIRNLYGVELVVDNRPGVIYKVGEEFVKFNVNIVLFTHSLATEDRVLLFIVGDFSEASSDIDTILDELKNFDFVIEARSAGKVSDIYYPRIFFPMTLNGRRVILLGPANMEGLMVEMRRRLGKSANVILFNIGYHVGVRAYEIYLKSRNMGLHNMDETIHLINVIIRGYGWAYISKWKYLPDEETLELEVGELWECETLRDNGIQDGSHLFRGLLSGLFDRIFQTYVKVDEVKCIVKGDEKCVFRIKAVRQKEFEIGQ